MQFIHINEFWLVPAQYVSFIKCAGELEKCELTRMQVASCGADYMRESGGE